MLKTGRRIGVARLVAPLLRAIWGRLGGKPALFAFP